jgi:hypothetical protein
LSFDGLRKSEPCDARWHRITVRSIRRHGVVSVSDGKDLRDNGDFCANQTIGVAVSVDTFVVVPNDPGDLRIRIDVREDSFADLCVPFHCAALL